jgi:hypothetical protein
VGDYVATLTAGTGITVNTATGAVTVAIDGTVATLDGEQTLTNKTLTFADETTQTTAWTGSTDQIIKVADTFGPVDPFKAEVVADLTYGVTIETWTGLPQFATSTSWEFGYDGTMTFPNSTVQTTAWNTSTAVYYSQLVNAPSTTGTAVFNIVSATNITVGGTTIKNLFSVSTATVSNTATSLVYNTSTGVYTFTPFTLNTNTVMTTAVTATNAANVTVAAQPNITSVGTLNGVTSNAATAFIAGTAAESGVALQMPREGALRNLYNGLNNMYFDVSIGGSTNGQFQFRSSNAFTNVLTMSPTAFNVNPAAVVTSRTPSFGRLPWNSAIDTELTIDDYRFRVSNSGGIYPQIISNVSGQTKNSAWTAVAAISGQAVGQAGSTGNLVPNNAWVSIYTFAAMNAAGDTVTVTLQDKNQGRIYRVTFMRSDDGSTTGYNIIAERLL